MLKKIVKFFMPYEKKVEVTSNLKMTEEVVAEPTPPVAQVVEPVVEVPVEAVVPEAVVVTEPEVTAESETVEVLVPVEKPKPKKPRAKKGTSAKLTKKTK